MNSAQLIKPEVVVFDWDGTLVNTEGLIFQSLNETLKHFQKSPLTLSQFHGLEGQPAREIFQEIGLFSEEALPIYYAQIEAYHLEALMPMSGAREILELLQGWGIYIALYSSKRGDLLRKELSFLGWESFFQSCQGAGDTPFSKPSRKGLALLLQNAPKQEGKSVWVVGDRSADQAAAQLIKASFIQVGHEKCAENTTFSLNVLKNLQKVLEIF